MPYLAEIANCFAISEFAKISSFIKLNQHGRQSPCCCAIVLSSTAFIFIAVSSRIRSIVGNQGWLQIASLPLCAVWLQKVSVGTVALFTPAIRNCRLIHHVLGCPTNKLQTHTYVCTLHPTTESNAYCLFRKKVTDVSGWISWVDSIWNCKNVVNVWEWSGSQSRSWIQKTTHNTSILDHRRLAGVSYFNSRLWAFGRISRKFSTHTDKILPFIPQLPMQ